MRTCGASGGKESVRVGEEENSVKNLESYKEAETYFAHDADFWRQLRGLRVEWRTWWGFYTFILPKPACSSRVAWSSYRFNTFWYSEFDYTALLFDHYRSQKYIWQPYWLTSKFYPTNVLPCPKFSVKFGCQSIELSQAFLGTPTIIEYYCVPHFQMSKRLEPVQASSYPWIGAYLIQYFHLRFWEN